MELDVLRTMVLSPFTYSMPSPSRRSNTSGSSNLWRIDNQVVVPPTYRGRELISPSVALEDTAWRATSSTVDQLSPDAGWRNPKDLHVSARLSSSRDVPRNEEVWATMLVSTRDRLILEVTTVSTSKTTGSTSWLPSSCRLRRRSRAFSNLSCSISGIRSRVSQGHSEKKIVSSSAFLRRSSALTSPSSDVIFGLLSPLQSRRQMLRRRLSRPCVSVACRLVCWRPLCSETFTSPPREFEDFSRFIVPQVKVSFGLSSTKDDEVYVWRSRDDRDAGRGRE